jgi:putative membrane protein
MAWWNDGTWNGYGGWWGGGLGMMFMMLIVWLPIIGLGVWLVNRVTRPDVGHTHAADAATGSPTGPGVESARAILDRRYASGEITAEQYAEMRRNLER